MECCIDLIIMGAGLEQTERAGRGMHHMRIYMNPFMELLSGIDFADAAIF